MKHFDQSYSKKIKFLVLQKMLYLYSIVFLCFVFLFFALQVFDWLICDGHKMIFYILCIDGGLSNIFEIKVWNAEVKALPQ